MNGQLDDSVRSLLSVGTTVLLEPRQGQSVPAVVQSFLLREVLVRPIRMSPHVRLEEGESLRITYWDETEILYCWSATLVPSGVPDPALLLLALAGQGVTLQRRQTCRWQMSLPFSCIVVDASNEYLVGHLAPNNRTRNISLGGLLFDTDLLLAPGDKLEITLRLGPLKVIRVLGWVVRSEPSDSSDPGQNQVAVKFMHLQHEEQIWLAQYLSAGQGQESRPRTATVL